MASPSNLCGNPEWFSEITDPQWHFLCQKSGIELEDLRSILSELPEAERQKFIKRELEDYIQENDAEAEIEELRRENKELKKERDAMYEIVKDLPYFDDPLDPESWTREAAVPDPVDLKKFREGLICELQRDFKQIVEEGVAEIEQKKEQRQQLLEELKRENARLKQEIDESHSIDELTDMEHLFSSDQHRHLFDPDRPDPIASLLPDNPMDAPMLDLKNMGKEIIEELNHRGRQMVKEAVAKATSGAYRGENSVEQEHGKTFSASNSKALKILSYNVWGGADIEKVARMKALCDLIQLHSPEVICFQEVTPEIFDIFQQSSWWERYSCSVSNEMKLKENFCMQLSKLTVKLFSCKPFTNSIMGRELCTADIEVQRYMTLVVATSHLESPCPAPPKWDQMYSKQRVDQAKEALKLLGTNSNVVFCGDMNWDDKLDGEFPLPGGWFDAWAILMPDEMGWTYDTKSNKMISANRTLQNRSDRFVCKLRDFQISAIDMIGKDAIPDLTYIKEKKVNVKGEVKEVVLSVLPSGHYGLLLEIFPK